MKTQRHSAILMALCATLSQAHAQLTWDLNGTGAGQTNGAGAWLNANLWWNGSANQDWVSGSNAVFGGPATAGGAVTLASPTTVGSLTFNPSFTGTYTLGTAGQAITLATGINKNASSGAVTLASPVTLGGVQTWTNNSATTLQVNAPGVTNAGHQLTIDGTGTTSFGVINNAAVTISGSGNLVKNGSGRFSFGGANTGFSGNVSLNGGVTIVTTVGSIGSGNLTLNGGVYEEYWSNTFARTLGEGAGQVQITGGTSGFGENGATGMTVKLNNNSAFEVVWGSALFSPSTFVLQAPSAQNGSGLTFDNKIDLNGADRTIAQNATTTATATIARTIRNTSGTAAGIIKTGSGNLILSATNTYDGNTAVNEGTLTTNTSGALPGFATAGKVTVAAGATLALRTAGWTATNIDSLRGAATWSAATSRLGFDTSGGSFTYSSNITEALSVTKLGTNTLTLTGNNSYSGGTSVQNGTLSFDSIANVGAVSSALGAPTTAANGTINIGSGGTAATITYTGSGHGSDRVIHLSGSTGGATIESSGTGPLTLTSPLTAAAGAKTLTLGGTNTGANSLPATSLAGLPEVLTVQKSGAGTWRINGFSSPKNAWSVTAGSLLVAGGITTGDQNVTVSGGTLAGVGPITLQSTKSLTVGTAGSLSPGISGAGTMSVTGILNISAMAGGTGKLNFEMAAPADSDKIAVTGTAQIGTGLLGFNDFVFTDIGGMTSSTYVLISTTGGIIGSLDSANLSGTIGSITGTLQINGNQLEFTMDADGDGIPDSWMVQYFGHSTGLESDLSRAGDDADGDGLANLQEYQRGTLPRNSDTDADGLLDGVESNTGTWVGASSTGTNPLILDSDGDTIRDGDETNTGTYTSATDTGTNPNKADTDADSLTDNVESNTGSFISKTNTGTDPNDSDSDNDGTGDWYEITASFTSPFLAAEKPDVPYPLPDPDTSTGATNKPVKVYIMSGQSNMVGFGTRDGTGDNSLETMTLRQNKFPDLINSSGAWTTRQDVRYRGVISDTGKVQLSPGTLGSTFGPELGFGYVMGWHHDEPVLLLKSSIGNRALGWDILPPGSTTYQADGYQFAAYGETPEKWTIGSPTTPWTPGSWYAGYEWDRFFTHESEWIHPHAAETNVVDVLDNFATEYPDWASQGFEIAGFVWWQGDRDRYTMGHATRYEQNLVNLINSLRSYYTNRYPGKVVNNAPFVLATLGQTILGDNSNPAEKAILDGMLAVDGESGEYPQYAGNVKTVYAHPLSEGGASNGHYDGRAGTYMLVGDALGRAMVSLEAGATSTGFAAWQSANSATGQTPADDHDGDGVPNGIEWFVMGSNSSTGFTALPGVNKDPGTGALSITWTKNSTFPGTYGTDFVVETSETLDGTWTAEASPGAVTLTGNQVKYTFPTPLGGRNFARIRVVVAIP